MRKQIEKIKALRHEKGFTLIELMAVLAILAVIIAIAVPAIGTVMAKSAASAEKSSIELMERAGELAHLDGLGFDDEVNERYQIPTLVSSGYLKLETDSPFHASENYVVKQSNGTFLYNGEINDVVVEPDAPKVPNPGVDFVGDHVVFGVTPTGALSGAVGVAKLTYDWTVPYDGKYLIEVWGAQGGNTKYGTAGELRTVVTGVIELNQGAVLRGVIGQQGLTGDVVMGYDVTYKTGGGGSGGGSTAIFLNDMLLVQSKGGDGGDGFADTKGTHSSSGIKTGGFGYSVGGSTLGTHAENYIGGTGGGSNSINEAYFDTVSAFTTDGVGNGQVRVTFIEAR